MGAPLALFRDSKLELSMGSTSLPYGYQYGTQVDTRIIAFNFEFHVNSKILKQHSLFFRNIIGGRKASPLSGFNYNYKMGITPMDGERIWYLGREHDNLQVWQDPESAAKSKGPIHIPEQWIVDPAQTTAFSKLIAAMYGYPWEIGDAGEFEHLVITAKVLGSLPVISNSLHGALTRSPEIIDEIPLLADKTFSLAAMLCHKGLSKESFTHVVGRAFCHRIGMTQVPDITLHSGELISLVGAHCERLGFLREHINNSLVQILAAAVPGKLSGHAFAAFMIQFIEQRSNIPDDLTMFYRELLEYPKQYVISQELDPYLKPIMEKNLSLDRSNKIAGRGYGYFVYANITDEELPWFAKEKQDTLKEKVHGPEEAPYLQNGSGEHESLIPQPWTLDAEDDPEKSG